MWNRPFIAFDIGSSSVKCLEFTPGRSPKIANIGLELLPRDAVADGRVADMDTVVRVSKSMFAKIGLNPKGRRAAVCVGGDQVLIKKIFMPIGSKNDMDEQIQAEAKQNFNADIDELYWQPLVMRSLMDERGEVPVFLIAVDRALVDQKIEVVKSLGMGVGLVDCEVFTLINMYEHIYGMTNTMQAIINIGASSTHLCLVYQGMQVYTRDIQIGGRRYTEAISEVLGLDYDNSEIMKIAASNGDQSMPSEIYTTAGTINDELAAQVKSAIEDFRQIEVDYQGVSIEKVGVVGGGSKTIGLGAAIATSLQLPTDILNPLEKFAIGNKKISANYIGNIGSAFAISCGLAIRKQDDHIEAVA